MSSKSLGNQHCIQSGAVSTSGTSGLRMKLGMNFSRSGEGFRVRNSFDFPARIGQVIDGEFIAKKHGSNKAWLIIKAVDSGWFEVWSSKPKVLEEMKSRFVKVTPLSSGGV